MSDKTETNNERIIQQNNQIEKVFSPITEREKFFAKIAITWKDRAKRLQYDNNSLKNKVSEYEQKYEQMKTDREMEHQEYVSKLGETEQLGNEVDGLLRREINVEKRVSANLYSLLASVRKVEDALSGKKPRQWFKFTWEVAIAVVALVCIWQYGYNPAFKEGIDKNALLIVILVGLIAFIVFRVYRGKNKK